ncbi:MAG: hypothetical protein GWN67_27285 [Phycisphaerae bacterium]|nr:hypothetical protein [Phycisphaerae bacterium]NIP55846.1 hypothetical protein [Phycisphaerae bacterium]NIS54438.1 hypothetical protein [Phycisphaerae bacterium]NIU12076.1 hypothetical protein [Phycisphaerae bacterium]NIU59931.1 hypothetical protein [Phycisphaerae bacterium]
MRTYKNTYISQSGRFKPLGSQKRICSALAVLLLFCSVVKAEQKMPPPQARAPVSLANDVQLPSGAALRFEADTYEQLRDRKQIRLTDFPLTKQESIELELEQFEVTTPSTIIVEGTAEGDKPIPHPEVVLFRGRVVDVEDSEAVIGISPYGNNGYIRTGDLLYYLSPDRKAGKSGRTNLHSIAEKAQITGGRSAKPFQCSFIPAPEAAALVNDGDIVVEDSYDWIVAFVAIECDYAYYQHFGGDKSAALAYLLQLTGTVSSFYERDMNIKWLVTYFRIWSSPDPFLSYPPYDSDEILSHFTDYWRINMGHIDRNIAMLFSSDAGDFGLAYGFTMCDRDRHFALCNGIKGWFPRPVQDLHADNWDLHVVAHEAGHVFGSLHTHCYDPPIDNCGAVDSDANDPLCQHRTVFDECVPGTIMSYCGRDLCGGYANELMSFHPRVAGCIRNYLAVFDCLRHGLNPVYTDWRNTGFENGTMAFPFNTPAKSVQIVIPDGTVYIYSGSYPESLIVNRPVTLIATGGMVTIGG